MVSAVISLATTRVRGVFVATCLAAFAALAVIAAPAAADSLPMAARAKLDTVVAAFGQPSQVDEALRMLDFPPKTAEFEVETWKGFSDWPAVRKLESLYHAAEASVRGSGDAALKDMMMLVAKRNPSIASTEAFRETVAADPAYVETPGAFTQKDATEFKPQTRQYAKPAAEALAQELPANLKQVVRRLVEFGTRDMVRVSRLCCGLPQDAVYDYMRKASSVGEVLEWAATAKQAPPSVEDKIRSMLEAAIYRNPALEYDTVLAEFRKEQRALGITTEAPVDRPLDSFVSPQGRAAYTAAAMTNGAPDRLVTDIVAEVGGQAVPEAVKALSQSVSSSSLGASVASEASAQVAARQFTTFQARSYGILPNLPGQVVSATPREGFAFSQVFTKAHGFGGVILGNSVTADKALPTPKWYEWQQMASSASAGLDLDPNDRWGFFLIGFADGTLGVTRPIRIQHAHASVTMIVTGIDGVVPPLAFDDQGNVEPFGLAGFTGDYSYPTLTAGRVVAEEGAARTFVVHPATAGLQIANDAVLVDAFPFNFPGILDDAVMDHLSQSSEPTADVNLEMFRKWLNDDDRSTYKFIDVPLRIARNEGGLVYGMRSDSNASDWPDSLRRQAFLTFQKFDLSGEAAAEEDPPFYPVVPLLLETWPHFDRLNDFAEISAIVRWLHMSGASLIGTLPEPVRGPTLTSLIVPADSEPRLEPSLFEIKLGLAEAIRTESMDLMSPAPDGLAELTDKIHELRVRRLAVAETMNLFGIATIAPGSEADALANAQEAVAYYEALMSQPADRLRLLFGLQGVDISGLESDSALFAEIGFALTNARGELDIAEQTIAQTSEGAFVKRLSDLEQSLANESPLSAGRTSVRLHLTGMPPDSSLDAYNMLLGELDSLRDTIGELETGIDTLSTIEASRSDDDIDSILQWVASDQERARVAELRATINDLEAEIASDDTSFATKLLARWNLRGAKSDMDELIRGFNSERINGAIESLETDAAELSTEAEAKAIEAEDEFAEAALAMPLPGFDAWWRLQNSYRNTVFAH